VWHLLISPDSSYRGREKSLLGSGGVNVLL
jgi:hypothetical protein